MIRARREDVKWVDWYRAVESRPDCPQGCGPMMVDPAPRLPARIRDGIWRAHYICASCWSRVSVPPWPGVTT